MKPVSFRSLSLAASLLMGLAPGDSEAGEAPVFHVSFDGDYTGRFGDYHFPALASQRKYRYGKGVVGSALFVAQAVEYPIAGVFRPERGTFSVWLRLESRSASMVVPGTKKQGSLACVGLDDPLFEALVGDGKWHHFVYVWNLKAKEKKQFLDGKQVRRAKYPKPFLERRYVFGAARNWIDELMLLQEPLPSHGVRALHAEYLRGEQPFRELPRGAKPFLPVELSRLPLPRPAPHRAVDWGAAQWTEITRTRKQHSLAGHWRFQPMGFMQRTPRPGDWLYVKLPGGTSQVFDQNLRLLEGYSYNRHKMMTAAKTGADMPLVGDEEEAPDEEDDFTQETTRDEFKDAGTYNWEPITSYCSAVLEREFSTPDEEAGPILLRFRRTGGAQLYLNGRYLGATHFIDEPAFDITGHLRADAPNRLTFVMGNTFRPMSDLALSMAPAVEVRRSRLVKLGKPLIVPSYRQKLLKVYLPADNVAGRDLELSVKASIREEGATDQTIALGSSKLPLKEGATGDVALEFKAEGLKEWSPETPNLYWLSLEVRHDGEIVDQVPPERFGFREVWAEGGDIFLNGKRLQLRGKGHAGWVAFTPLQIDLMRSMGMNSARTLDWNEWDLSSLEVTDEKGFLLNIPMWIDPSDREAARKYFRKLMSHIGNHPSIIEWMIGGRGHINGPHGHPMQIGGRVPQEVREASHHYKTSRLVNEIDPTGRLAFFHTSGVGGNVRGIMHSLSFGTPIQEMEEWVSHWAKVRQEPLVPREQQIFSRPDYFFHRGSKESVVLEQHARYFGESAYLKATEGFIESWRDIGEDRLWATPEYWKDFYELAFTRALRSWRTYGISGYWFHASFHLQTLFEKARAGGRPTAWGETVKRVNAPCLFYIGGPEEDFVSKDHSYFEGEEVAKSAIVVNDTLHDIPGTLSWSVVAGARKPLVSGEVNNSAPQGRRSFLPIRFVCPEVEERTVFTVTAKYAAPGEPRSLEDTLSITVFPRAVPPRVAETVGLVDTSGRTEAVLKKMGVPYTLLDEGAEPGLGRLRLLVVGKNSFPKLQKLLDGGSLNQAVEAGLNVLILEQMNRNVAGLTTECFKTRRAFQVTGDSAILSGFGPEDFIDWRGESTTLPPYQAWCEESNWRVGANLLASKHGQSNSFGQGRFWHWSNKGMVATFCYQKPQLGNFRILLQNGFDCLYTPLVEFRKGAGKVLFCQLDVCDRYGADPVATTLLDRLLTEGIEPAQRKLAPLSYLGGDEGREILDRIAVEYQDGLDGNTAYVSLSETDDTAAVEQFVKGGGTVLVSLQAQSDADKLPVTMRVREAEQEAGTEAAVAQPGIPSVTLVGKGKPKEGGEDDVDFPFEDPETDGTAEESGEASREAQAVGAAPSGAGGGPRYFDPGVPRDGIFAGISLSDLYYRRTLKRMTTVETIDGRPASNGLIGVIPVGKGRIVYLQPEPGMFDDAWKETKVIRLYNTILNNLGVKSRVSPDFSLIGGYGMVEEWLPGYYPKVPDRKNRPMVKESPLYRKPALNFDPNVHYVW